MFHLIFTTLTIPRVANQSTSMNSTRQNLIAYLTAKRFILLTTLHRLLGTSATTLPRHHCMASGTRSRMTKQTTCMFTALLLGAKLTTTVSHIIPIVLWILGFSTETPIGIRNEQGDMLAGWTTPTSLILGTVRPFNDAIQMNDVEAIGAGPCRLERFDSLTAHKTFEATCVNFPDELFTLGTFAGVRIRDVRWLKVAIGLEFGMFLFVEFLWVFDVFVVV